MMRRKMCNDLPMIHRRGMCPVKNGKPLWPCFPRFGMNCNVRDLRARCQFRWHGGTLLPLLSDSLDGILSGPRMRNVTTLIPSTIGELEKRPPDNSALGQVSRGRHQGSNLRRKEQTAAIPPPMWKT
jgi:hypothetical protein